MDRTAGLSLATPAGAWQLACSGDPAEIATAMLDGYYGSSVAGRLRWLRG